jgi:hypothetical protein
MQHNIISGGHQTAQTGRQHPMREYHKRASPINFSSSNRDKIPSRAAMTPDSSTGTSFAFYHTNLRSNHVPSKFTTGKVASLPLRNSRHRLEIIFIHQ